MKMIFSNAKAIGKKTIDYLDEKKVFSIFLFCLYLHSYRILNVNMMLLSSLLLISMVLIKIKADNLLFSLFILMIIVFVLNMPLIDLIRSRNWHSEYELITLRNTINNVIISIVGLFYGYKGICRTNIWSLNKNYLANKKKIWLKKKSIKLEMTNGLNLCTEKMKHILTFERVIFLIFLITFFCKGYAEIDKYIFMQGRIYEDFYKDYIIKYPGIIRVLSNMYVYFFVFQLALYPDKKQSIFLLTLNVVLTIPLLIIGKRAPFILSILYIVVYFIIRDEEKERWINRRLIILGIVIVPIIMVLMTLINYSRSGFETHGVKLFDYMVDFLYRQGFTFKVNYLGVAYSEEILLRSGPKNFVIGEIIDIFKYGKLSQVLFNSPGLPLGNSEFAAKYSYNYAHALSSIAHPKYYLGHGYGSSYILEAFQTYGIIGVMLISYLIGGVFRLFPVLLKGTLWTKFIALMMLERIFFIPRSNFASIFSFMFKPTFVFTLILLWTLKRFLPSKVKKPM